MQEYGQNYGNMVRKLVNNIVNIKILGHEKNIHREISERGDPKGRWIILVGVLTHRFKGRNS